VVSGDGVRPMGGASVGTVTEVSLPSSHRLRDGVSEVLRGGMTPLIRDGILTAIWRTNYSQVLSVSAVMLVRLSVCVMKDRYSGSPKPGDLWD